MIIHLLIALVLGGIAGVALAKLFDRVDMGMMWNIIVGALGGVVVSTYLAGFGVDERDPYIWSLLFAVIGGLVGVLTIGLCRPGLKVFWDVLTGKSNGVVERK